MTANNTRSTLARRRRVIGHLRDDDHGDSVRLGGGQPIDDLAHGQALEVKERTALRPERHRVEQFGLHRGGIGEREGLRKGTLRGFHAVS